MITLTMRDGRKQMFLANAPDDLNISARGDITVRNFRGYVMHTTDLDSIRSISMSTAQGTLVIYKRPNSKPKKEKRK